MKLDQEKAAILLLRLGLAFVFSFAAFTALTHPENYFKYVPTFISNLVPINLFLLVHGIGEILLSIWLLTGKWTFWAAFASAILLFIVTLANLTEINILFRNVAIITGALALASLKIKHNVIINTPSTNSVSPTIVSPPINPPTPQPQQLAPQIPNPNK